MKSHCKSNGSPNYSSYAIRWIAMAGALFVVILLKACSAQAADVGSWRYNPPANSKGMTLSKNSAISASRFRTPRFGILAAALLVMFLTGCASIAPSAKPDPSQYNPTTGYPFLGGPLVYPHA